MTTFNVEDDLKQDVGKKRFRKEIDRGDRQFEFDPVKYDE